MKSILKKSLCMTAVLIMCMGLLAGCGNNASAENNLSNNQTEDTSQDTQQADASQSNLKEYTADQLLTGQHAATIEIQNYGTVKLTLDADKAPISVTNFAELANSGFYNGLTFHRIIDGFMIQGGDPQGTGMGGSDQNIKGEFSENGVQNDISHVRGVISMARSQDFDSASSQFFIVQSDSTFLDGQYAAFGMVTEGIEIVDQICKDTPVTDNNGTVEAANQPIITSIVVE